ncbi:hypothetical protein NDU88_001464 [Pleurodeles waltl]|uniref:Uncharacterized protein n=1 Tax=Pleurodeles waltl TaxID=8319 RepID=A0AAV7VZ22_PLEWA|nr:hypothetical protein NDU88_001464 [Pleurodeles waltl]
MSVVQPASCPPSSTPAHCGAYDSGPIQREWTLLKGAGGWAKRSGCVWLPPAAREQRRPVWGLSSPSAGVSCSLPQLGCQTARKVTTRAGASALGQEPPIVLGGGSQWWGHPRARELLDKNFQGPRNGQQRELTSQGSGRRSRRTRHGQDAVLDCNGGSSPRQARKSQPEAIQLATNLRDPNRRFSMELSVVGGSDTETKGSVTLFPSVRPHMICDVGNLSARLLIHAARTL